MNVLSLPHTNPGSEPALRGWSIQAKNPVARTVAIDVPKGVQPNVLKDQDFQYSVERAILH
jgi:hypothetical protein